MGAYGDMDRYKMRVYTKYRRVFSWVNRGDLSTIIYLGRERNSIDGIYK